MSSQRQFFMWVERARHVRLRDRHWYLRQLHALARLAMEEVNRVPDPAARCHRTASIYYAVLSPPFPKRGKWRVRRPFGAPSDLPPRVAKAMAEAYYAKLTRAVEAA